MIPCRGIYVTSTLTHKTFLSTTEHKRDAARAEDSVVLSYGTELIGMQRDWNEELQSCREFPHGNPQERFLLNHCMIFVT
jgi:protein TIF31